MEYQRASALSDTHLENRFNYMIKKFWRDELARRFFRSAQTLPAKTDLCLDLVYASSIATMLDNPPRNLMSSRPSLKEALEEGRLRKLYFASVPIRSYLKTWCHMCATDKALLKALKDSVTSGRYAVNSDVLTPKKFKRKPRIKKEACTTYALQTSK